VTVRSFTVGPFAENTYVLHDSGEAAIVDPGTHSREERDRVARYVESRGLRVRHLLLTHGHIDHILGCAHVASLYASGAEGGGWALHPADAPLLQNAPVQGEMFGLRMTAPPAPTRTLEHGDEISLGETTLEVRHAPGHSPGSVVFVDRAGAQVIGGDVLFQGSIGRTDLWGGDYDTLLRSIREQLLPLPDETRVFAGHGPPTTIGEERRSNPFLQD
jgi:glyoxylase-like metal-dependent hydrolase (beta-lactamase superfamily II)